MHAQPLLCLSRPPSARHIAVSLLSTHLSNPFVCRVFIKLVRTQCMPNPPLPPFAPPDPPAPVTQLFLFSQPTYPALLCVECLLNKFEPNACPTPLCPPLPLRTPQRLPPSCFSSLNPPIQPLCMPLCPPLPLPTPQRPPPSCFSSLNPYPALWCVEG